MEDLDLFENVRPLVDAVQKEMTATGKAPGCEVQARLLKVNPRLLETKPRIRVLSHYLMHMRSKGAPIKFDASRNGVSWVYFV